MPQGGLIAVTVIGDDRPGIVASVTKALYEAGCNLEDVSSTILRGHFAMMLIVRTDKETDPQELEQRLQGVGEGLGLIVTARPISDVPAAVEPPTHMVSAYGADRPGIVFRVTELLARYGINVTDLTSRVIGPADAPVYALMLEVVMRDEGTVREGLSALSAELNVDVSLRALEVDVL
jgi:glycine cleavage system transcriptional repressor